MSPWLVNLTGLTSVTVLWLWLEQRSLFRSYLSVFSVVWLGLIVGSQLAGPPYAPDASTVLVLYGAWFSLLLGAGWWVAQTRDSVKVVPSHRQYMAPELRRMRAILLVLILANLAATLWFLVGAYRAGYLGVGGLAGMRLGIAQGNYHRSSILYQLFSRVYVIYVPMAVLLRKHRGISGRGLVATGLVALVVAASLFTRAPVLQVGITFLAAWSVAFRPRAKFLAAAIALGVLMGAFFYVTESQLLARASYVQSGLNPATAAEAYMFGSARAYQAVLQGEYPSRAPGIYSLDFVNYPLERLGLISSYPPIVRSPLRVPPYTNTYTFLDAPTLDLGVLGAMIGAFIIGGIAALVYGRAHSVMSVFWVSLYAFVVYGLSMAFLNNEFIRFNSVLIVIQAAVVEWLIRVRA